MKAYILINARMGAVMEVVHTLRKLELVHTAEMTFGDYDAIAVVNVPDLPTLARLISHEIQPIPGITRTITCMAVDI